MARTIDELLQIVRNGGSLDMKVGFYTQENLVQLAQNLRAGSIIILRDAQQRTTADLVQIAANASKKNATASFVID